MKTVLIIISLLFAAFTLQAQTKPKPGSFVDIPGGKKAYIGAQDGAHVAISSPSGIVYGYLTDRGSWVIFDTNNLVKTLVKTMYEIERDYQAKADRTRDSLLIQLTKIQNLKTSKQ